MKPLSRNEVAILRLLEERPRKFGELEKELDLSRPVISKHLKSLQKQGFVIRNSEREYESLLKRQIKKFDVSALKPTEPIETTRAVTLLESALRLTADKETQVHLTGSFVKWTLHATMISIAKVIDDTTEAKDLPEAQAIIKRFIDQYLAPRLQLLAIEASRLGKLLAELSKHPDLATRPFRGVYESELSEVVEIAKSAFLEFATKYTELRKTQIKKT